MSQITIQASTTGYFTVLDPSVSSDESTYAVGQGILKPESTPGNFTCRMSGGDTLFYDRSYRDIINGDTGQTFTSAAALKTYIKTNFFRKAGGSSGAVAWGAITGTLSAQTDLQSALDLKTAKLVPTNVKTGAYPAVPNDFIPVDTTGGSVVITLPTDPADKASIGIKHVIQGGANTVTFNCGGTNKINKAGGPTSGTLVLLNQAVLIQFSSSAGLWYVFSDDLPLSQLDIRYAAAGSGLLASNNLSDVASMATSRQNLGLQTVWNRKGTVIYPSTAADQQTCGEPTVILDTNPVILTSNVGNVFKMWFTQGWGTANICYAESPDGATWTRYPTAVVANRNRSFVLKNGSTYYMYAANLANTQLDRFTSSDGVAWTLANSAVVTAAGSGWTTGIFSPFVFIEGGVWKMLVDGITGGSVYGEGYYTSADGITWVQGASNPVLSYTGENPYIFKVGSTYWLYGHGNQVTSILPCDIFKQSSTDLIHWSAPIPVLTRQTVDEGAGLNTAQISDISMLQVGNSMYLYYTSTPNGGAQSGIAHIKLAVANMPLAQLVTTAEGAGGDIITQQPNFIVDPATSNLTYTGGNYNTFGINAPLYPNLVLLSNGTNIGSLGGGVSSVYTTANDFSLINNNGGNISVEAANIQLKGTVILNKTGSFGLTSSLSNGNWNFATSGAFQFYFNYKSVAAQSFNMTMAGNQLSSPQNADDFLFASTANVNIANGGSTQSGVYAQFNVTDKALILNGGASAGFTSSGSRLQTTSISTGVNATAKVASYAPGVDDNVIRYDATGGALAPVLPTAVGIQGREYILIKTDASANAVTVNTTSSQNIGIATTYALTAQGSFVRVKSNNASWDILGNTSTSTGFANPMTTLGDVMYGGAAGIATRLAGQTTIARAFLSQTQSGGTAAAPAYFDLFGTGNTFSTVQTFQQNGITTTLTDAIFAQNNTASTSGATRQSSPLMHLGGRVWNTSGTPADNWIDGAIGITATSGANPIVFMNFYFSRSATSTPSLSSSINFDSNGNINMPGGGGITTAGITMNGGLNVTGNNFSFGTLTGGSITSNSVYMPASASGLNYRSLFAGTTIVSTSVGNYGGNVYFATPVNLNPAASGTNPLLFNVGVAGFTFANSGATVTDATSFYIDGPPSGTAGQLSSLYIKTGTAKFGGPVQLMNYTVATLPASPVRGMMAYVTDATTPTYLGALTGGGAVVAPVFYNGSAWLSC